jgi:hypothetical protein
LPLEGAYEIFRKEASNAHSEKDYIRLMREAGANIMKAAADAAALEVAHGDYALRSSYVVMKKVQEKMNVAEALATVSKYYCNNALEMIKKARRAFNFFTQPYFPPQFASLLIPSPPKYTIPPVPVPTAVPVSASNSNLSSNSRLSSSSPSSCSSSSSPSSSLPSFSPSLSSSPISLSTLSPLPLPTPSSSSISPTSSSSSAYSGLSSSKLQL